MKIAIFGNTHQREKSAQVIRLFEAFDNCGVELYICSDFYRFLQEEMNFHPTITGEITGDDFVADLALSVGGDGTFLRTAQRVGDKGTPILGINMGRLGFLADITNTDIEEAVTELLNNYYKVEPRTLLYLQCADLPEDFYPYALNEIAVAKRDTASMMTIHATVDDLFLNSYQSDGLIVATPTGSTAYSLSVGGPVLMPQAANMVITPVAPHSLNVRPLVIDDNGIMRLRVVSRSNQFVVSADGRSAILPTSSELVISKAPFVVNVVKRHNHDFFEVLRSKLMWGVDKRNV